MIDKIQTLGLAAKGAVYAIIGALTAMAAFDMGGSTAGRPAVINFLQQQPFGKFILYLLSIGILAYALWRLYTAIADPKSKGDDASGIAKRIGYFFSSLIYLFFSISIFSAAMSGSSGGGSSKQHYAAQLMDKSYGPVLIALIGLVLIGVGVYQIHKGYSGKYLKELNTGYGAGRDFVKKCGKFGFMARGVIFAIIGYFVLRAGVTQNADIIKGTQGAFQFLQQQSYGAWLMGFIAIGLLGYGLFMMYVSKDSRVYG